VSLDSTAYRLAERLFGQKLIQNQFRSLFVEALIAPRLEIYGWHYTGDGWCGWDFQHGPQISGCRLEVKQSAARQTWSKHNNRKTLPIFDIKARTGYFVEEGSKWIEEAGRPSHIYLFAWHPIHNVEIADHRDPAQWEFYLTPEYRLPQGQKTISLSTIETLLKESALPAPISFKEVAPAIEETRLSLGFQQNFEVPANQALDR